MIGLLTTSCKKEKINYTLNFEARHWVDEENQFAKPGGSYNWSIADEDFNYYYENAGSCTRTTVTDKATAKSGDYISITIGVNDAFDNASTSCESDDGSIFLYATTDNMFIQDDSGIYAKSVTIRDSTKKITFRLK